MAYIFFIVIQLLIAVIDPKFFEKEQLLISNKILENPPFLTSLSQITNYLRNKKSYISVELKKFVEKLCLILIVEKNYDPEIISNFIDDLKQEYNETCHRMDVLIANFISDKSGQSFSKRTKMAEYKLAQEWRNFLKQTKRMQILAFEVKIDNALSSMIGERLEGETSCLPFLKDTEIKMGITGFICLLKSMVLCIL